MSGYPEVVAGVDIGGTSTSVVLIDAAGEVLAEAAAATPAAESGRAMMNLAVGLTRDLAADRGLTVTAVGIGAAGVVDPITRTVVAASSTFSGWAGFDVGATLDHAFGVPNALVNDVNAFLLGEVAHGSARGLSNVAGITLGTGVGGALYLDDRLWDGPHGAAGELGHTPGFVVPGFPEEPCTCGQYGHLESIASGRSIARRYRERGGADLGGAEIAARSDYDADARAVLHEAGLMVGQAAVSLAVMLDITHLVVGGGVAGAWAQISGGIDAYIAEHPPVTGGVVSVTPSLLGGRAVAVGAAAQARALLG